MENQMCEKSIEPFLSFLINPILESLSTIVFSGLSFPGEEIIWTRKNPVLIPSHGYFMVTKSLIMEI
jgi:hypothetical protein